MNNRSKSGFKIPVFLFTTLAAFHFATAASAKPLAEPEVPEDLGARAIDVSDYPAEYQKTYKDIFLPAYQFVRGGPARAINSPSVSSEDWKREVMALKNRPACCGACLRLTMDQARALWRFFVYDSSRRKTGARASAWGEYRKDLVARFDALQESKERKQ